jgi:hypothetical protein
VWHERTSKLRAERKLDVLGIVEEQHPDRSGLFLQWKGIDWPVLADPLNLLGVKAVPLAFLVDEHGVVRRAKATPEDVDAFLAAAPPKPEGIAPANVLLDPELLAKTLMASPPEKQTAAEWLRLGDAFYLSGRKGALSRAIDAYGRAASLHGSPEASFRLGVALRSRFESAEAGDGDFRAAIAAWGRALEARPDQYIWRRRLEQYGPRLEKPYAFYDWVEAARKEVAARGGKPVELGVEPRGSELAGQAKTFAAVPDGDEGPDPAARVPRDEKPFVRIECAVAPAKVQAGKTARVHIAMRPNVRLKAHWNNEARPLVVWLSPPAGVELDARRLEAPNAATAASSELRTVECELRAGTGAPPGRLAVPGYALYFVCEDVDGVCYFLRQEFDVALDVAGG